LSHFQIKESRYNTAVLLLRSTIGAIAGLLVWIVLSPVLTFLPEAPRFYLVWLIFTLGPGLALGAPLMRDIDLLQRGILQLGLGSSAVPVIVELTGRTGLIRAFPYLVCALGGLGVSMAAGQPAHPRTSRRDLAACFVIAALAFTLGAVVFAHRLIETPDGLAVYGDYDSFDLSHYAAWASDATHTIPPRASFYSGHGLHAAYYPQLILTMVHRFAGVELLPMYFRYAWPTFLALGGLTAFVLVRRVASTGAAVLAVVLLLCGSDFSYLAAWLMPEQTGQWDYVLWPTNFLAPTMEVLHFNTWGPSLPVFFTALYALVRVLERPSISWTFGAAFLIATLFQFKPFAYIVLMAGACAAWVFAGRDWTFRRRLALPIALTGLFTLPFVYNVLTLPPEDRRSDLVLAWFVLPERMLIKLDLTGAFNRAADALTPVAALQRPVFLLAATALFLVVGPGVRWLGAPHIWRALRDATQPNGPAWRMLAWIVVAGVAIPFVLATDPYNDTLQFYQAGLYVWWIFTAVALTAFAERHERAGMAAIAIVLLVSIPSSIHYLARKWNDNQRPALAALTQNELSIARYLRTQDANSTVILHDRPTAPSLMTVASDRRVVLGWGRGQYAVGSAQRVRDVDRFFTSDKRNPADALDTLQRYAVTHIVVRNDRDHVHPDVLARLTPLMSFSDVTLYAAPGKTAE
jgi:hypothetical protein